MKKKSTLVWPLVIPTLMTIPALSQNGTIPSASQNVIADEQNVRHINDSFTSRLWENAKTSLQNAKIKYKVNLPSADLANGLNVRSHYQLQSQKFVNGKFSGIDIWEVNLSAWSALFNVTELDLGLNSTRQITFIRQFNSQAESLKRVPYDPFTKLPRKASIFDSEITNIFTGEKEKVFKVGDFVAYRTPITLNVGKNFYNLAGAHLGLSAGINYIISGEFDVHIFVMDKKMVRVKLIMAKDKSLGGYVGLNLLGLAGSGQIILDRILDKGALQAYVNKTNSELFSGDYVFNLNTDEGKAQYDKLIGSKFNIMNKQILKEQLIRSNPFAKNTNQQNSMLASFEEVNQISNEDIAKPVYERRVIKVSNLRNQTFSETSGLNINIFRVLKMNNQNSKSESAISIFARDASDNKEIYKLDLNTNQNNFKFAIWGGNNQRTTSVLTQLDEQDIPIKFVGLQQTKLKESSSLSRGEFDFYFEDLKNLLPEVILSKLQRPNWNFSSGPVKNTRIEEEITFNEKFFSVPMNVEVNKIKEVLLDILSKHRTLESIPMQVTQSFAGQGGAENSALDSRMQAFNMKRYLEAYDGWETHIIPMNLSVVLNSNNNYRDRYRALKDLIDKVPLFNEIQPLLILRLLPSQTLEQIIAARLVFSAKNQPIQISTFPNLEQTNSRNLFREILAQNSYATNRSYNLRYYIKEDGSLYSIEEILN